MPTVAICSLKGGVGKTTSTFHLAGALAEAGRSVLVIDADPQGCLTESFRADSGSSVGLAEVLSGQATVATAAQKTRIPGIWLVPSSPRLDWIARRNLAGERVLMARMSHACDFVLIDCPSCAGVLLANALLAADGILIPAPARPLTRSALTRVIDTVREMRDRGTHPDLDILGVLVTQFDPGVALSRRIESELRQRFGSLVLDPVLRESETLAEASDAGEPITAWQGGSSAADDVRAIAKELTARASARSGFFGRRASQPAPLRVLGKAAVSGAAD